MYKNILLQEIIKDFFRNGFFLKSSPGGYSRRQYYAIPSNLIIQSRTKTRNKWTHMKCSSGDKWEYARVYTQIERMNFDEQWIQSMLYFDWWNISIIFLVDYNRVELNDFESGNKTYCWFQLTVKSERSKWVCLSRLEIIEIKFDK